MTLRELVDHVTSRGFFNKVGSHLQTINPEWAEYNVVDVTKRFRNVVDELADLPGGDEISDYVIVVDQFTGDDTSYIDVYLEDSDKKRWSVDFVDWNELIDLRIKDMISNEVSQMLAHILYEMTWWGRTRKSILDQRDELERIQKDEDNLLSFSLSSLDG